MKIKAKWEAFAELKHEFGVIRQWFLFLKVKLVLESNCVLEDGLNWVGCWERLVACVAWEIAHNGKLSDTVVFEFILLLYLDLL